MRQLLVLIPLLFLYACDAPTPGNHQGTGHMDSLTTSVKDTVKKYGDMKQYWLVFLKKGENRTHDSVRAARIQKAHLENIERLANEDVIIMAGPMGYKTDKDLRGIFIMDARDSATAASYIRTDSAIITGRLRFEIHPWWAAKGTYVFD